MHPQQLQRPDVSPDWEALIRVHDHAVFLSLLARGVRPTRARELVHETWARLYEQWRASRLDALELPGLAIAQAAFLARGDGRSRAHPSLEEEPAALDATDPAASPEARIVGRQLLERVAAALDGCPERARALFELAWQHPDVPQAELASRLGVSLQRFRQALCEVRARLRRAVPDVEDRR